MFVFCPIFFSEGGEGGLSSEMRLLFRKIFFDIKMANGNF